MTFTINAGALLAQIDAQLEGMLVAAIGAVDSTPPSLQQQTQPTLITGTFTSQSASESGPVQAVLQTAQGQVTLTLNAPPPQGTVTVQIQPGVNGAPATATVLVPSTNFRANVAPQTAPVAEATNEAPLTALPAAPPLQAGATITGTLMPSLSSPGTAPTPTFLALPNSTPAYTPSLLEAIDPVLAAQEESAPALPSAPASAFQATPQTSNEAFFVISVGEEPTVPPLQNQIQTQTQTQTQTQPLATTPAQPSAAAASSSPAPSSAPGTAPLSVPSPVQSPAQPPVQGNVIASTPGGQPILALPSGTLLVNEPATVATGTSVTLQPLGPAAALPQIRGDTAPPPLALAGKEAWPALTQTLATLTALEPEQAAALQTAIPTLNAQTAAAPARDFVSSFVAFLTTGQIEAPPLPAAQAALQAQASSDDIKTLRAALTQVVLDLGTVSVGLHAGAAASPAATTWQAYPIPVLTGAEIAMLQLYVRPHIVEPEEEEKDASGKPKRRRAMTRFLVEVHPGALGPVQLDGLVQKDQALAPAPEARPHLDLIVRTEAALPSESETEMGTLFDRALGATGVTGRLAFQVGRDSFVLPESGATHAYMREV